MDEALTKFTRPVVHLDADAFFAAVEQAADARLRGRPVVVGGERRGVVVSASYEARRFGIRPPMPTARARKLCPKLIVLPGDFEKYEQFSQWMFSYAYDFTPDVEICSLDEGYVDLRGVRRPPIEVAATIRDAIRKALKISVSEGIGNNKLVSQIASKLRKPAAFECVLPGRETEFLHPLSNRWLPGVGPRIAERLNTAGLVLIRHIAAVPTAWLALLVGHAAPQLKQFANGVDDRPVVPASVPAESYSKQDSFDQDQTDEKYVAAILRQMADTLFAQARADGKSIRTITVRVRYNDRAEDHATENLAEPTDLETDVYNRLDLLLRRAWRRRVSLRAVSLKLSNLYRSFHVGVLPFDRADQKRGAQRRLADVVDRLRAEHGHAVLLRGHDFILKTGEPNANLPDSGGRNVRSHRNEKLPMPLPLVVRSHYSFLNSTLSPETIVAWARKRGLSAVAICDHWNLHGAVEFSFAARAAGLKPVLGVEMVVDGQPLWLYVEDAAGYANLCRMISDHAPDAKPQCATQQRLAECGTDGLIGVSRDLTLAALFPGRFYRALTCDADFRDYAAHKGRLPAVPVAPVHYEKPEDRLKFNILQSIRTLTLLQQPHPEKLMSGDHHFGLPTGFAEAIEHRPELVKHTWEIAERCNFAPAPGKPQFPSFVPPDGSTPGAFLRTLVLQGLKQRYGERGAMTREGSMIPPAKLRQQAEEELTMIHTVGYEEYFLVVWDLLQTCRARGIEWITRGSAADSLVCYCLGISNVCPIRFELYFRRFLNPDRMALNKLPDIDIDFPHDRKDDVLNILFGKYGRERCAVVGGFSTFHARSAFAEVAKVLGVAERDVRRFTERFPWSFGGFGDSPTNSHIPNGAETIARTTSGRLKELLRANPECADLPIDEEPYSTALDIAEFLEGIPRYPKMHPCGVVLSRQPMHELTPTFVSQKGYPTTHFDMDAMEAIGLVKLDILAQGGLAVMRDAALAMETRGVCIDIERFTVTNFSINATNAAPGTDPGSVPTAPEQQFGDPAVWDMISGGNARAVHHIESPAMISLCRMCNVRDIDTLIAVVSVIRPGAANEDKKREFARRCQGLAPPVYAHPSIEPCLRSTFGLVVYEEHILQICEAFAGLSAGRADVLRRALVKNKMDLVAEFADEFAAGARRLGRTEPEIQRVWELLTGFHGYAFCKAHSTAYGVEAYQSAWLKRYFPAEYMAAVLTNGKGFYQPLVYVLECWRLGIPLLPPRVNEPGPAFTVVDIDANLAKEPPPNSGSSPSRPNPTAGSPQTRKRAIRVPVTRVRALTQSTQERLLAERARAPFRSIADFYLRVRPEPAEMEALIRVGAFDEFGAGRCEQFWEYQRLRARWGEGNSIGQGWLIPPDSICPTTGNSANNPDNPDAEQKAFPAGDPLHLQEPTRIQRLHWEVELLGFPASGHPLDLYPDVAWDTYCPISRAGKFVGQEITLCGLVIEDRVHQQTTGEPMKFLTVADRTGILETELFAPTYKAHGLATVRYPVLEVSGRVETFENGRGFTLRVLRAGQPRLRKVNARRV